MPKEELLIYATLGKLAAESDLPIPRFHARWGPVASSCSIRLSRNLSISPELINLKIAIASAVSGGIEICSEKGD